MILFSGTSNPPLAQSIADELCLTLGAIEITRFIDNECRVFVKEDVEGQDVFVIQSLSMVADQHLVELCLIGSALKDLHAKSVTAVIPWMGYSKQDKAFRKGEAVSAQLVAKFIEAAGFDRVITVELHSENVLPYFRIPIVELSTHKLLAAALQRQSKLSFEHAVVVSPDIGGKSRSEQFAQAVGLPVVYLEKSRDLATGRVQVTGIQGVVKDTSVIIFDDIINTGATAAKTSEFVKKHGAKHVYFLATHAVLAGNSRAILSQSVIDTVIVTDTIIMPLIDELARISVVSVAPLLADAIRSATG
jgi:ribose-phosphate pyrophosphokinase